MTQRTVIKEEQYACPKCMRNVTFRYEEIQFGSDEIPLIGAVKDKVISYGQCEVAEQARVPGHPVVSEIQACPYFKGKTL